MSSGRRSTPVNAWGSRGIYIDVDISSCGFVRIPTVTTTLEGDSEHHSVTGITSLYRATRLGFRLFIRYPEAGSGPSWLRDVAIRNIWNVEWVAVGYTC